MYLSDKIALEDLRNCSVCISTNTGIRNVKNEQDIMLKNVVYVENILPTSCEHLCEYLYIISEGQMVKYKPINVISR